jgi:hypothetical protein
MSRFSGSSVALGSVAFLGFSLRVFTGLALFFTAGAVPVEGGQLRGQASGFRKERLESIELRYWKRIMALDIQSLPPKKVNDAFRESVLATQNLLNHQGTRFSMARLGTEQVAGFVILPDEKGKPLNQLAFAFEKHFPEWKLVYSPVHSLRGSNGFFIENARQMGLSNRAIEMQSSEPTFVFNRVHIAHYQARLTGVIDPLSPFALIKRDLRSDKGVSIHPFFTSDTKRARFQDLEARVASLKWLHAFLRKAIAASSSVEAIEGIMKLILKETAAGAESVLQIRDLAERASSPDALRTDSGWKRTSSVSTWAIWTRGLRLSAFRQRTDSGWEELAESVDFFWDVRAIRRSEPRVGMNQLLALLRKAESATDAVSPVLDSLKRSSSDFITAPTQAARRASLRRALEDLEALEKAFDQWKLRNSKVSVPQF